MLPSSPRQSSDSAFTPTEMKYLFEPFYMSDNSRCFWYRAEEGGILNISKEHKSQIRKRDLYVHFNTNLRAVKKVYATREDVIC